MNPTLFVSWRSPTTRSIHPIGRIAYHSDSKLYEFAYIRSAVKATEQGFLPMLEFPDLNQVYFSDQPFPLVANRLMPAKRPDYPAFMDSIGLPSGADPMTILARTGGRRETDQFEMFPVPEPDADGCFLTHCLVRAIRYVPAFAQDRILSLNAGERLYCMWDAQNPVDPRAVALRTADETLIGYLPAYLTGDVWSLNAKCGRFDVFVEKVNQPPAEVHHRLLVKVQACWPQEYRPFQDAAFQPLARPVVNGVSPGD